MLIDLSGRTALVTGSSLGIGFAIAKGLHDSGANVIVNGRDAGRVEEAVARLGPDRVRGVTSDVGTLGGCQTLISQVPYVDILVNNVGAFGPQPFLEVPDSKWFQLYEVNVMSGVRLSQHYIPGMLAAQWGRILFISSVDAVQVPDNMVDYAATKLAQVAVSRGIAQSLRGTPITSNALLVGPTHSAGFEGFVGVNEYTGGAVLERTSPAINDLGTAVAQHLESSTYQSSLIARMASCEEVANMAVYLASEQAAVTTGAAVRVDGGVVRGTL
jgi:NAD(P)-dependent dehydrogenase (short-subunit alcohol dehydrogenase family)